MRACGACAARARLSRHRGIIRWRDTKSEVSLFGANYALPTASDYRGGHGDRLRLDHLERIQLSLRPHEGRGAEVEWIALAF